MAKLVEMDEQTSISTQMEEHVSPVILIEKINVDPEEVDLFLKAWVTETNKFKKEPGFILTQLYKGIGRSGTFIIYAIWESVGHFEMAVSRLMDPHDRLSAFPPSTVASPHLFKKVAVPGICVD